MSRWPRVSLGKICESVDYGVTASASPVPVGPKFLRITDIQSGSVNWDAVPWCECDTRSANESQLEAGDIVFARTGATTGKSFLIDTCPRNAVFASYLIRVRVLKSVEPRYVSNFFQSADYWAQITKGSRGAAQPGVNATTLKSLEIPLPPLPEQRRIAAILDQADALRAKRREALAQLDSLTQSIFIEMFGDPARNTLNLPTTSLDALGSWHSGGTPPRSAERYFVGEIPWFSSGELESMYVSKSAEHVSADAIQETAAKLVPSGALMLGMYDTAALKASISAIECSCNQAIAFSKINSELAETVYVYYAIVIGREHFRRLQRGVRQKNLNLSMIREIRIPCPSLSQQRIFVNHSQAIESLKATHRAALQELDRLFASLQHRAFSGEL